MIDISYIFVFFVFKIGGVFMLIFAMCSWCSSVPVKSKCWFTPGIGIPLRRNELAGFEKNNSSDNCVVLALRFFANYGGIK